MSTILLTEDNEDLLELIQFHLEKEGYTVLVAKTGMQALRILKTNPIDIVILDLMLPEISGLEILAFMKKERLYRDIPVFIESAKSEDQDIVKGLELGAEDYITKPFSPKVLIARVQKILSRSQQKADFYWTKEDLYIHIDRREVLLHQTPLDLTQLEFDILVFLASHAGNVLSREQILDGVWKNEVYVIHRVIDVHVTSLRKKLQSASSLIQTVRGIGYKMEPSIHEK
ncbi:MAG: response regulator transcription factor [Caldisericia bacterium]|nr:response regulator transcription factor [Caldisericia bacterium]